MKPAQAQLHEIASVSLGITLRGSDASRHDPEGTHQLIRIGDLSEDGTIQSSEPNLVKLDSESAHRSALRIGDVLLAARGSRMTAALFLDDHPAVASGQLLVIRTKSGVLLPDYLTWYLNLATTQDTLTSRARGSYVRSLPVNALAELTIPLPPMDRQYAIAELRGLRLREKYLMTAIASRRAVLIDQSVIHSFHV